MPFDVEKEAGDWIAKWIDGPDLDPEDVVDVFEGLKVLLARIRDETEEECIEAIGKEKDEAKEEAGYTQFAAGAVAGLARACVIIHERRRRRERG